MPEFLTENDSSWVAQRRVESIERQMYEQTRPSVLFQPRVFQDGNMWCCLKGKDIMEGLAAFGETPDKATRAFDEDWQALRREVLEKK